MEHIMKNDWESFSIVGELKILFGLLGLIFGIVLIVNTVIGLVDEESSVFGPQLCAIAGIMVYLLVFTLLMGYFSEFRFKFKSQVYTIKFGQRIFPKKKDLYFDLLNCILLTYEKERLNFRRTIKGAFGGTIPTATIIKLNILGIKTIIIKEQRSFSISVGRLSKNNEHIFHQKIKPLLDSCIEKIEDKYFNVKGRVE
jgi:hypothetical protein